MDDFALSRVVHVLAVLLWIGGVAFVTLVLMPAIRRNFPPEERLIVFHRFEQRFAWQARVWVALAGLSGLWLIWRADMWYRFADPYYWWMHAMVLLWLFFAMMLYVIEPFLQHRHAAHRADPGRAFARMEGLHRLMLFFSLVTVFGAVGGSHGLF